MINLINKRIVYKIIRNSYGNLLKQIFYKNFKIISIIYNDIYNNIYNNKILSNRDINNLENKV